MTVLLGVLLALLLPARIDPGAPFPHITQEAPTVESIAPGIEYGEYQLVTDDGPLWVHVVAVEPHRNDVRVGSVLAANALESHGETIGSMARRTGAVAGINGDYFDIGNTNRPQNIVISGGALLQLPYKRFAIAITRDGLPHIAEFSFSGQLEIDQRMMPLDGIDRMPPPNGGLSLLTPEYGRVRPSDNVTLVSLAPLDGTPPLARYRVTGVADNLSAQPPGYYVAIGPNDYGVVDVPDVDATVTASGDLAPLGLDSIVAAIGGGPHDPARRSMVRRRRWPQRSRVRKTNSLVGRSDRSQRPALSHRSGRAPTRSQRRFEAPRVCRPNALARSNGGSRARWRRIVHARRSPLGREHAGRHQLTLGPDRTPRWRWSLRLQHRPGRAAGALGLTAQHGARDHRRGGGASRRRRRRRLSCSGGRDAASRERIAAIPGRLSRRDVRRASSRIRSSGAAQQSSDRRRPDRGERDAGSHADHAASAERRP